MPWWGWVLAAVGLWLLGGGLLAVLLGGAIRIAEEQERGEDSPEDGLDNPD